MNAIWTMCMKIKEIRYGEYEGQPNAWALTEFDLVDINLLVGKNSAGKSRTASVLFGLTKIFSGDNQKGLDSGFYRVVLDDDGKSYLYILSIVGGVVCEESLHIDDEPKLVRHEDGSGEIFYEDEGRFLKFKISRDVIALAHKQDELQHSFLSPLIRWGKASEYYQFGTDFGRQSVLTHEQVSERMDESLESDRASNSVIDFYLDGYRRFGEAFDNSIMDDMRVLGYHLFDVGCGTLPIKLPGIPTSLYGLYVKEEGVNFNNFQGTMSQGMYRALALAVALNYSSFRRKQSLIVIDDIGEGLDFNRSKALINLVIDKVKQSGSQLAMTTNDQFVMNNVPLEYWQILTRSGTTVTVANERNSKKDFAEFKFMGLNNFDFFASQYFN